RPEATAGTIGGRRGRVGSSPGGRSGRLARRRPNPAQLSRRGPTRARCATSCQPPRWHGRGCSAGLRVPGAATARWPATAASSGRPLRAATECGVRSARSVQYPGTLLELGLEGAMLGEPLDVPPPVTVTVTVVVGPTAEWSAFLSDASIVCCPGERPWTCVASL